MSRRLWDHGIPLLLQNNPHLIKSFCQVLNLDLPERETKTETKPQNQLRKTIVGLVCGSLLTAKPCAGFSNWVSLTLLLVSLLNVCVCLMAGMIIKRKSGEIPCPLAVEAFAAHLSYICKYDDKYSK